jgi:hypothetical protein
MVRKAPANDFAGRFREIISDPLNLLIRRHSLAGTVNDGLVVLHNGHRVPLRGAGSYYDTFSDILIYNRGVHEPLEEWVFQEVLKTLPAAPTMLELGAYWGHYSMWLKQARPDSTVHLVEPDAGNLAAGRENFSRHGYSGHFHQAFVGHGHFEVDAWMAQSGLNHLYILHSDIQGFEVEMLEGASESLKSGRIGHVFVSTHNNALHQKSKSLLDSYGYRIDIDSDPDTHTTSCDGFLLATKADSPGIFHERHPLGRTGIVQAAPPDLLGGLQRLLSAM